MSRDPILIRYTRAGQPHEHGGDTRGPGHPARPDAGGEPCPHTHLPTHLQQDHLPPPRQVSQ